MRNNASKGIKIEKLKLERELNVKTANQISVETKDKMMVTGCLNGYLISN